MEKTYNWNWRWCSASPVSPCDSCPYRAKCEDPSETEIGMDCREYRQFAEHMSVMDLCAVRNLAEDSGMGIREVINFLAMADVPMSGPVIRLGIALGELGPEYHNGWGKEVP